MNKIFFAAMRPLLVSFALIITFSGGAGTLAQNLNYLAFSSREYIYLNLDLRTPLGCTLYSISLCNGVPQIRQNYENHARGSGINEGRPLSLVFHAAIYRQSNPDLNGLSNRQLYNHYNDHGSYEGRQASWVLDPNVYRAANPDVAGMSNRQLITHYLISGKYELRRSSPQFDARLFTLISVKAQTYPPEISLTTNAMPSVARPGYLSPIVDPIFGTKVTHISNSIHF